MKRESIYFMFSRKNYFSPYGAKTEDNIGNLNM